MYFFGKNTKKKPWGKDELIFFVKILYVYVKELKDNSKKSTLFDQEFFNLYSRNEEQRCMSAQCESNCRILSDLRDKFKNMMYTWENKSWCFREKEEFNELEVYLFDQLRNILETKNLFWIMSKTESEKYYVRIYIYIYIYIIYNDDINIA